LRAERRGLVEDRELRQANLVERVVTVEFAIVLGTRAVGTGEGEGGKYDGNAE
jgi:hypothetical protein